ncbi:DUF6079 family protein [Ammonifex thiophilus]|uniref:ATP-binding protein n=1 Tax=Ammonifex thiophilus TaxID=444093 RepID=A0A3D8P3V2_9THEO|nr:DUF6079 family protein [Ammonifex thiophilus]RDV81702.1 ATP-binding protein [Ammonifex thiophilus]
MKYGDLIQFEPLETIIELRSADDYSQAERLVATYVISEDMKERLTEIVFPNLQFERPADNKGLLVVGNYGTGKSHLMSVLSAIAEHKDLVGRLKSPEVAEAAQPIAGKFKVIRTELGSTTMDFREFICAVLEEGLAQMGVSFKFPPRDKIPSHKPAFEEMMAAFHERYPDHGLLLVVDELLDYLGSRKDQELMLDLIFLREIGEICKNLRFRFIAGLQEALFDNPRFAPVANTLLKVKDRFEQVFIARRDIKFVVAERLLKKTAEQQLKIREHLQKFTRFYGNMNERLDEFVSLFPIHPDYIEMFERVRYVEKRAILKTISQAIKGMLDQEVPPDAPGILSYDHYWKVLKEDRSFRTIPEVREVIEVSTKLEELVETGYPKGKNKDLARRIIWGLSLHRLTIGDIEKPVGLTAEALRDTLCLFDPLVAELGGDPADDLRGEVETALRLIVQTVNGQFISATEQDAKGRPSGQFYLDIKKTVDYDAQIYRRAESLDNQRLDHAYFKALARVLDCSDSYYPDTHLAWEYEIEWKERKAPRIGYMFFGTPNQRSTAQPPRDFYLFFLPIYELPPFKDEKEPRDVFFRLSRRDELFETNLKRYAGAFDLAQVSSGKDKNIYEEKANKYLQELVKWLRENALTAFDVTYQGRTKPLQEWIKKGLLRASREVDVRDLVNLVASTCLAAHFENLAPEYPEFSVLITSQNLGQAAQDALRWMKGAVQPKLGRAVLEALELIEDGRLHPRNSRYARYILELLQAKEPGRVLNRDELIQDVYGVEYMAPDQYRLEPELVVVLLAALVYTGDAVLALPGNRKFDAGSFGELVETPIKELVNFRHLERPKEWNLPALQALFEFFGLPTGLARQVTQGDSEPVQGLQAAVEQLLERVARAQERLRSGTFLWGQELLPKDRKENYAAKLAELKGFLESLRVYSSAGMLKNLRYDVPAIEAQREGLEALKQVENLLDLIQDMDAKVRYLSEAEKVLPEHHPWIEEAKKVKEDLLVRVSDFSSAARVEIERELAALKRSYIESYVALHAKARLGAAEDRRKSEFLKDKRLEALRKLATINILPTGQLTDLQNRLAELKSCPNLTTQELEERPWCPHCGFKPREESADASAATILQSLDEEMDRLLESWTATLVDNLADPTVRQNLELLKPEVRVKVEEFLQTQKLPSELENDFIQAVRELLKGLNKVTIGADELKRALAHDGQPATLKEIKKRFEDFLNERTKGMDPDTVRIVLE